MTNVWRTLGLELIVHTNPIGLATGIGPFSHGSARHTEVMKTEALKQALDDHGFDVAFGGARRDEEKSRAKERIFSFRTRDHRWDQKTSVLNSGPFTTLANAQTKPSAFSLCQTGPSLMSGNIS